MISVQNLSIHFNGKYLFDHISFIVQDKDRIGLTGKNGAGKSTLLKILSKQREPENGTIILTTGHTIGYLPQEMIPNESRTVMDEVMTAFDEIKTLEKSIDEITQEIAVREDYESAAYQKLLHDLSDANDRFHLIGGQNTTALSERVLLGLGFRHSDFQRGMAEFSSGWQMRVELAKILLQRPNVMLLDEPTNHLDIDSIQWLEEFLQTYEGAVVLVSHDRTFLDNATNRTIEITLGKIEDYKVSYSDYIIQRAERRQTQLNAYENQQKEIADMERFVEKFRYKATKAKQAQSRLKMLEKMDKIEVDDIDQSHIHFRFPPAPHSGKVTVHLEEVNKSYGEKRILEDVTMDVLRGEKIAFVGRNGEGKSTLSKIIVGELDHEGTCQLGHQVKIGYFAQNQAALLDGDKTVFETIDEIAVGEIRTKIRNLLGNFLFSGEDIEKKVKVLSGGEKTRLALAKLLLSPVNLLVLDEPTNHLDMSSKDILKNALIQYDGAMILVSHDRDFLQGLTTKVYEFKNRHAQVFLGDIQAFLEAKKLSDLKELEAKEVLQKNGEQTVSNNKLLRDQKKKQESELRKIRNRIEQLEKEIEQLEKDIRLQDELLHNHPEIVVENASFYSDYEALRNKLNMVMQSWENENLLLEEVENQ